ncbi:MAG: GHKL domain-containing protein [Lachnospiraceae bacterium]|jgi:signal transduction histidine kinase|nr:GHKL domain-containing protein [Lachnospiraceae bacterium]
MRKTLYPKFILAYIIFAFFGFVIISTFVATMTQEHLRREKADALYREAILIANTYAADLYNNETSLDTVKKQIDALDAFFAAAIWIINPSGLMILDSRAPLDLESETIVAGFDPMVMADSYYIIGSFFDSFDSPHISVLAPIVSNFRIYGYVAIHYPMSSIAHSVETLLNISYLTLIILLLLSLIILIFFTAMVYLPLRKITYATEQYAHGNMHYELHIDSEDEIGYLAASLSYMASEIARAGDDQKKFVANVSHDFRSPLTSIRGYLEAMQDGTIPPDLHGRYIDILTNETDRLIKLTNSLLTLNNLNMKGMFLDKEVFDINQAIRDTAVSFEGTCRKKKITIVLILTDGVVVKADKDKIEQVLYNLLDNAIKFSHRDSQIAIETTERHSKVFISVKDNGVGIPKSEQKLVFDRFFKSDSSRGRDRRGTGLGLAIVKEIINSHNEHINVISTEGEGTEFVFSLALGEDGEE